MEKQIKTALAFSLLTLASAFELSTAAAQPPVQRPGASRRVQTSSGTSGQAVTFHNNFTSANITGVLTLPSRQEAAPAALVLTGASATDERAANDLSAFLAQRGIGTFRLPASALEGSAEDRDLNALAALSYLRSRRDVRASQVGIVAYGDGVRMAPVVASQANAAAFLVLLGGDLLQEGSYSVHDRSEGEIVRNLNNVHCPVLIVQGELDSNGNRRSAADNVNALRDALNSGDHGNITVKTLPEQNQSLTVGNGSVYGEASSRSTLSVAALRTAADWLGRQNNRSNSRSNDEVESSVFRAEKPLQIFGIDLGTPYHSWYDWKPDIGGQHPIFGYWYW